MTSSGQKTHSNVPIERNPNRQMSYSLFFSRILKTSFGSSKKISMLCTRFNGFNRQQALRALCREFIFIFSTAV
jgi:hypothetical protein